jgi:hypothetical protein
MWRQSLQEQRLSRRPDPQFYRLFGGDCRACAEVLQLAVDPQLVQLFLYAVL